MAEKNFYATGKRKTAIARVWIKPGSGNVVCNKLSMHEYFGGMMITDEAVLKPFTITENVEKYDVMATLRGGGKSAQMDALRHGISKALLEVDPEFRLTLKKAGLLTRDPRAKERKKSVKREPGHASSSPSVKILFQRLGALLRIEMDLSGEDDCCNRSSPFFLVLW